MLFENGKRYWCFKDDTQANVKPWEGLFCVAEVPWYTTHNLYPLDDKLRWVRIPVFEEDLFHTEKEAKAAYIKLEVARIYLERIRIANEIIELMAYKNEI